jgi:hypothetical protein
MKPITNPNPVYSYYHVTISLSVSHFHFNSKTVRSIQGRSHESFRIHRCSPIQEHSGKAVHGQPQVGSKTGAPETNIAGSHPAEDKQFKNLMQVTSNAEPRSSSKDLRGLHVHTQFKRNNPCWKFYGKSVVTICTTCFYILKLCIPPTECICMLRMVLTINCNCFTKQNSLVDLCSGDVICFLWGTDFIFMSFRRN